MSFINSMLSAMKLDDDEYYDDEDFDIEDDFEEEEEKPKFKLFGSKASDNEADERSFAKSSKVTPISRANRKNARNGVSMEVCVIKPSSFSDAKEIAETLLAERTVILNIEGLDYNLAQRILDFSTGCCYAINGNIERINNAIIILSPPLVSISGDLTDFVDALDFNNL